MTRAKRAEIPGIDAYLHLQKGVIHDEMSPARPRLIAIHSPRLGNNEPIEGVAFLFRRAIADAWRFFYSEAAAQVQPLDLQPSTEEEGAEGE